MKLVWAHLKAEILELVRYPAYAVPTLAFPGLLFLFFAVPNSKNQMIANQFMASYATFAVLGVAFFQFGVGIATDRESPWQIFLRILPVSPQVRFTARVLAALAFALAAIVIVFIIAALLTPAGLNLSDWILFSLTLLLGSIPFGLMGIALGYWAQAKAALPIANLLYLSLSYTGGLWLPPGNLPRLVAQISPYLPTRIYAEAVWIVVQGQTWRVKPWFGLASYALGAGLLAVWGYRRDEGQNYR